ncbi:hypothetical protein B484DRAFT_336557 [Ochromonadaceae sp. CCMP2298]|nr:hypothetical protein B484DRAFT_336557 [Ochromonadaceae sp. CCMP2298]
MGGGLITSNFESLADDEAPDAFGRAVDVLPKTSSSINFGEKDINIKHDLWVVGCGTMGEFLVQQCKSQYPDSQVVAETLTTNRQARIEAVGAQHKLRESRDESDDGTARTVIICLPPSLMQQAEYVEELFKATRLWAGPEGGGNLVYTSSLAVYGPSDGNTVTEAFRVDTRSSRSTMLLTAEESIMSRGGNVIRLAGLYTKDRGPHTFWMKKSGRGETIDSNADGLVNMLHYEDAAAATLAVALSTGFSKKIFLACDNEVTTREEICESAVASGLFPGSPMPAFASESGAPGKICDCSVSRGLLNWQPVYTSFRVYMRRLGGEDVPDVENSDGQEPQEEKSLLWIPGGDDDDLVGF